MVGVISADEMDGEERVQSTADPENGRFRHMSGARQTSAHIHTYRRTKTTLRAGQADTQSVSQSGASRPLNHSIGTIQNPLD